MALALPLLFAPSAYAQRPAASGAGANLSALPPLRLPADVSMHPKAAVEWWYCTGHLTDDRGRGYGFESSFIKAGDLQKYLPGSPGNVIYRNDTAITDESAHRFYAQITSASPALTGASASTTRLDLHARSISMEALPGAGYRYRLHGAVPHGAIDLTIRATRPAMLVGGSGLIPWGDGYSYYYSFTRPAATGTLTIDGRRIAVHGTAWMDHQWGNWSTGSTGGWTWMGVQLADGTDVDLFRGELHAGHGVEGGATAILPDNRQVTVNDVSITPLGHWRSPVTHTRYALGWRVRIPSLRLDLTVRPTLRDQELVYDYVPSRPYAYWEGSSTVTGTRDGRRVSGKAYAEIIPGAGSGATTSR